MTHWEAVLRPRRASGKWAEHPVAEVILQRNAKPNESCPSLGRVAMCPMLSIPDNRQYRKLTGGQFALWIYHQWRFSNRF